jgi:hypothetical protein
LKAGKLGEIVIARLMQSRLRPDDHRTYWSRCETLPRQTFWLRFHNFGRLLMHGAEIETIGYICHIKYDYVLPADSARGMLQGSAMTNSRK